MHTPRRSRVGSAADPQRPLKLEGGSERRLAALRATGLLDTPAQERFDRLTRLARCLMRTPVTAVSLLDADRQFFLSAQGLPEPWAGLRETPLSYSFCRSVVETGLPFLVRDARCDPRVRGNPAITELGVVAYLGVPLALPDGCVIGALCAIDSEPRGWAEEDERALTDLAGAAMAELAAGLQLRELNATGAALRGSEARLRSILDTVPDGVLVVDEHGIIEAFSTTAELLFGYAAREMVGRDVTTLFLSPGRDRRDGSSPPYAATGGADAFGLSLGHVGDGRRKDGSTFPVEIAFGEVRADGRWLFTGFVRDLTHRRAAEARLQELQAELLHVSRVSAAGEMASALAHELNQPLTAVASAVRAAQRMLANPPDRPAAPTEIREAVGLAAEQALRAGQIVRRLRDFVIRDGEADKRAEDLGKLAEVAGTLALVGARERGVRIDLSIGPQLPLVFADRIQIQQVLLNLIRNALEAMVQGQGEDGTPRKCELSVTARLVGPDWVEVAVADTGPGLAPAIAGRLFESFVSGKPGGMGMGLSICRSIVDAHGGRLWAAANPGGGAVFRFTLPVALPDAAGAQA